MSIFRRNIVNALESRRNSYIEDGLVFHLDAIDRGPDADAWTDLVGGIPYYPTNEDVVFGYDYIKGQLLSDRTYDYPDLQSTIEVCMVGPTRNYSETHSVILGNNWHRNILFATFGDGTRIIATGSLANTFDGVDYNTNIKDSGFHTYSVNRKFLLCDGAKFTPNNIGSYHGYNPILRGQSVINKYDNYFKIHSIRIYNRLLTEKEMLHNQEVDRKRFDYKHVGRVLYVKSSGNTATANINEKPIKFNVTPNVLTKIAIDEEITSVRILFQYSNITEADLTNFDISKFYNLNGLFGSCPYVTDINLSNCDFSNASLTDGVFKGCKKLVNLKFGKNLKSSIDFSDAPLTHKSALSVINGLATVTAVKTVTFNSLTYLTLTPEEIALATSKGWTVVDAGGANWFNDAIICWYDIKRQGCTNENMAEDPVLLDLSGKGRDMQCNNFAWTDESGISEDGEYLVFDGVGDVAECLSKFVLTDFTQIFNRNAEEFIILGEDANLSSWSKLSYKVNIILDSELRPITTPSSSLRVNFTSFGTWNFHPLSLINPNGTTVFTPKKNYYDINNLAQYTTLSKGKIEDSEEDILKIGHIAPLSLKQYLLFNRTLTEDEINWVKTNLIRQ